MMGKQLSELEQDVMNVVWRCKKCSIKKVRASLKRKLAYTTVATIFQRLHNKGFVTKKRSEVSQLYFPRITKETYSKNLATSFVSKFFNSFGDVAIASFVDSLEDLPRKKRDYLLRLLEKHEKDK